MRLATLLFAFLTFSASGDFFIGDSGVAVEPPRVPPGRILVASDQEIFYVIARNGMNRVDSNGVILDREPFGIHDMLDPVSVAYGRGRLLITHRRSNSLNANSTWATAMTTAGEVLWTTFIANSASWVVYDGSDFVVVYGDEPNIRAAALDETGFAADRVLIATYSEGVRPSAPRAVSTAGGLLAVWRETGNMRAVPFDANGPRGEVMNVGTASLSGFGTEWNQSFALASSGADALVAWINSSTDEPQRSWLSARRIDTAGRPTGELIEVPATERMLDPDAVWDGVRYHVGWVALSNDFQEAEIRVTSLPPPGGVGTSTAVIRGSTGMLSPAVAVTGDTVLLIAWNDFRRGGVRGRMLAPDQAWDMTAEQILRTVPFHATAPAAVWTGEHYVVAWLRSGAIAFRRFTREGVALDAEERLLVPYVSQPTLVRIATTASETAIVWTDQKQVFVIRIAADGTSIDAEPILVATRANPDSADIASDGRRFMIVWAGEDMVHARRLSGGGGFVDGAPIIVADTGAETTRVAFDGSMFVVGFVGDGKFEAASLSTTGVAGAPVLLAENVFGAPAVASNGSTHLFTCGTTYVLAEAGLSELRVVEGPFASYPDAIWTGTRFVVAGNANVVWVSADGELAPAPLSFVHSERANALATTGDGTALLVYSQLTRSFRASLYGRLLAPRRRAAARPE